MENENYEAVDSINLLNITKIREEAKVALFNALGPDHYSVAEANYNLAECYSDAEDYEKAHPLYLEAARVIKDNQDLDEFLYQDIQVGLANSYFRMAEFENALTLSLELLENLEDELNPTGILLKSIIADCYEQLDNVKEEIKVRQELAEIYKLFFGEYSDEYLEEKIKIVSVYEINGQVKKALSELNKLIKLYPLKDEPRVYIDLMITKLFCYRDDEANLDKTVEQIYKALEKFEINDEEDEMLLELYKKILPDIIESIKNKTEEEE